jgi:hypothetical protein
MDLRHLHWLATQIGSDLLDAVLVTTGPYALRRPDGIAVVPAVLLGRWGSGSAPHWRLYSKLQ